VYIHDVHMHSTPEIRDSLSHIYSMFTQDVVSRKLHIINTIYNTIFVLQFIKHLKISACCS